MGRRVGKPGAAAIFGRRLTADRLPGPALLPPHLARTSFPRVCLFRRGCAGLSTRRSAWSDGKVKFDAAFTEVRLGDRRLLAGFMHDTTERRARPDEKERRHREPRLARTIQRVYLAEALRLLGLDIAGRHRRPCMLAGLFRLPHDSRGRAGGGDRRRQRHGPAAPEDVADQAYLRSSTGPSRLPSCSPDSTCSSSATVLRTLRDHVLVRLTPHGALRARERGPPGLPDTVQRRGRGARRRASRSAMADRTHGSRATPDSGERISC
jgi:hypothetical protein